MNPTQLTDFATRYASRPERDEAQLMAAQAQLELGRSSDAEAIFQRVADSSSAPWTPCPSAPHRERC